MIGLFKAVSDYREDIGVPGSASVPSGRPMAGCVWPLANWGNGIARWTT
jgi:hypothetical protein